jgi:hypothetical protein
MTIGCGKSEPKKKPAPTTPEAVAKDAAKLPAASASMDAGIREHMREHFESIRSIERAIIVGDKDTAREQAKTLAEHPSIELADYEEEIEAVRVAAAALAKEESLEKMAQGGAQLASLCGHCHLVTTSITTFEWSEPPAESGTASERMQRHLWAMERLWEGLVGPSEMSWREGSKVLQASPFPADKLPIKKDLQPAAKKQLASIAALAVRAGAATERADQVTIYGELLGTCSGCHAHLR